MDRYPDWLSATLASDAAEGRGVLPAWIGVLQSGSRIAGPAFVVQASQDDNLAVSQAVTSAPAPGCVLVVGGHSTSRAATCGDLLALEIKNAGIAGLVTNGLVRDAQEIRKLGLSVWCRGVTPIAPGKRGPSAVGGSVPVGGTIVRDGDLVIADDDGVVIWPKDEIDALLPRAEAKLQSDNARLELLRQDAHRAP